MAKMVIHVGGRRSGKPVPAGCIVALGVPVLVVGLLLLLGTWNKWRGSASAAEFGEAGFTMAGVAVGAIVFGLVAILGGLSTARQRRAAKLDHVATTWKNHPVFPPPPKGITQGARGVRIPLQSSSFKRLIGIVFFAVVWNGISGVLFTVMLREKAGWFPIILISIFLLVGIVLLCVAVWQFFRWLLVRDPHIEISGEPLVPGQRASFALYQPGRHPITSAEVKLVCSEVIEYTRGTRRYTDSETVYTRDLVRREQLRAHPLQPILQAEVEIPPGAMHSFYSDNNEISWRILVDLDIPGRPDVHEEFIFRVRPAN